MTHNPIRPWRNIDRRASRQIRVGKVLVGGDAPISVQTMTNTLTTDVAATIEQIQRCAVAGADIVRVSTPDQESTRALREIVAESPVPDRRRHPFPLQARHRGGRGGGCLPADQPRQHR
jgi:(E)-4-hydroxy-3-methylbut-2-enyl-diphosphate synthase